MSGIVRITRHPAGPDVVLVHAGPDLKHVMGLFGPARWSAVHRAFELPATLLEAFTRHARHHALTLIDARADPPPDGTQSAPPPFQPLPECQACGTPYRRGDAEILRCCIVCGAVGPWAVSWGAHPLKPGVHPNGVPTQPVAPGERAAAVRELVQQAAAERPAKAVRSVPCPHCGATCGSPCIAIGSDRPLTITDHHQSRYDAAGGGRPRVDAQQLGSRFAGPIPAARFEAYETELASASSTAPATDKPREDHP